jgi:regulatory protein
MVMKKEPKAYELKEVQRKIAHYCAYQERCETEVKQKLQTWQTPEKDIAFLIEWLKAENYINENRFAATFSGSKFRSKKWGKQRIVADLKRKGMSEDNIKNALENINETDYKATLAQLLRKKLDKIKETDIYKTKQKLFNYALQKGYEMEAIATQINKLLKDN